MIFLKDNLNKESKGLIVNKKDDKWKSTNLSPTLILNIFYFL